MILATVAGLALVHLVAAACLVLVALLNAAVRRSRAAGLLGLGLVAAGAALVLPLALGGGGLATDLSWLWDHRAADAVRAAQGIEFINDIFGIGWGHPPEKLALLAWAMLGPYRLPGLLLVAGVMVTAGLWLRRAAARAPAPPPDPDRRAWAVLLLALLGAAWLAPVYILRPGVLFNLDLRLMTLVAILGAATLPRRRWFAARGSRGVLAVAATVLTLHAGARAVGFAGEAQPALQLLARARPAGVLKPLLFHNRTAHYGKLFRLTHYLPTYYTVGQQGISTQLFVRQMSPHLPVSCRPGGCPWADMHADWSPQHYRGDHLERVDYVLLEAPVPGEDAAVMVEAHRRLQQQVRQRGERVQCRGRWCLYRMPHHRPPGPRPSSPGGALVR